jgi:hypothetical protein
MYNARKAWAEECVRKASEIARGIARSQQVLSTWEKPYINIHPTLVKFIF